MIISDQITTTHSHVILSHIVLLYCLELNLSQRTTMQCVFTACHLFSKMFRNFVAQVESELKTIKGTPAVLHAGNLSCLILLLLKSLYLRRQLKWKVSSISRLFKQRLNHLAVTHVKIKLIQMLIWQHENRETVSARSNAGWVPEAAILTPS